MTKAIRISGIVILIVALFNACSGGSGKGSNHSKSQSHGVSSCTPDPAEGGQEMRCSVEGLHFSSDKTIFIQTPAANPLPMVPDYDADNQEISFLFPNIPFSGSHLKAKIFYQDNKDKEVVLAVVDVKKLSTRNDDESETVIAEETPAPTSYEEVAETPKTDTAPEKTDDKKADTTAAKTPAPAPLTLDVQPVAGAKNMQTVSIYWKTEDKVKARYLAGELLNLTDDDVDCTKSGDRYRVTNEDGSDIDPNPATPSHIVYADYLEGKVCNNDNEATDDDCDFTYWPVHKTGELTSKLDGYSTDSKNISNQLGTLRTVMTGVAAHGGVGLRCRTDLPTASGKIFTRNLQYRSGLCLVAVLEDGTHRSLCTEVVAGRAAITTPVNAMIRADNKIHVDFDYVMANREATISGKNCVKSGANNLDKYGIGHASYSCDYSNTDDITVTVEGFGKHNDDQRTFKLSLGNPHLKLNCLDEACKDNWWESGRGVHDFEVTVGRPFSITETNSGTLALIGETTAGIPNIGLKAVGDDSWKKFVDVPLSGHSEKVIVPGVPRDHTHTAWYAWSEDFASNFIEAPYKATLFSPNPIAANGWCQTKRVDDKTFTASSGAKFALDSLDYDVFIDASHIKTIRAVRVMEAAEAIDTIASPDCPGSFDSEPNTENYDVQKFHFVGKRTDLWPITSTSCRFVATDMQGREIDVTPSVQWSCSYYNSVYGKNHAAEITMK